MFRSCAIGLVFLLCSLAASAEETVRIEAVRDATLIEDPDGALANGSGPFLFAGRTGQPQNGIRRGLLYFDVAAAVPARAIIQAVSLTLYQTSGNVEPSDLRLHRVLADWAEGPSSPSGGSGAPALAGDATWLHSDYDVEFWVHAGGQFVARSSAGLEVAGDGYYTWDSSNDLVRDVRLWKSSPRRNAGWILIGDETARQTAKKFASREHPDSGLWPMLEITYRLPADDPRD